MSRPVATLAVALAALLGLGLGATGCATATGSASSATTGSAAATTAPSTASAAGAKNPPATRAAASPGCTATGPGDAVPGPRGTPTERSLASGGTTRTFQQVVPTAAGATPVPLVVDLHGYLSGAAGQAAISNLGALAESAGFVLVTPQGSSDKPYWNAAPDPTLPDDVAFVSALIDDVAGRLCIDPARVYVDGFSNGAFLASLVACRLADKVAAVAAVSGLVFPAGCAPVRPIPVLALHGTADRFVTYDGGPNVALETLSWNDESRRAFAGIAFAPVTTSLARWGQVEGCTSPPVERPVTPSVSSTTYEGCRGGSVVRLDTVAGGGHTWPGSTFSRASAGVLGATTFEIDADAAIWQFFVDHPMPG